MSQIPIVEEMWCKNCDQNPAQTVMENDEILCGFCGKVMYTYGEEDMVKEWDVGWSKELKDVKNGVEPLVTEITRLEKKGEEE